MGKKKWAKIFCFFIIVVITLSSAGCRKDKLQGAVQSAEVNKAQVRIRFFSNLPDRTSGQGKLEQLLIDNYMKENKNIEIQVEALQDEPYKQKFKAYAVSNELPDVFTAWGQASFFEPIMKKGYAAELSLEELVEYGFLNGSLKGFSFNDKLYGVPRNTDYMVLYYNEGVFNKYKMKPPKTYEELLQTVVEFREKGIVPIAISGKDKWPIALLYQELVIKEGGDQNLIYNAIGGKVKFTNNEILKKAAENLQQLIQIRGVQDNFAAFDYEAAKNLFIEQKAAMYYTGSWEIGMDTNPTASENFKKGVNVIRFPYIKSGKGKASDLMAWNGGGYAVAEKSPVKEEALKLLKYMMKPENWSKNGWQMGLVVPSQNYNDYLTGKESKLQNTLTEILNSSTSLSSTAWNDSLTPEFKTDIEELCQQLAKGIISSDIFLQEADKEASKAN